MTNQESLKRSDLLREAVFELASMLDEGDITLAEYTKLLQLRDEAVEEVTEMKTAGWVKPWKKDETDTQG